MKIALLVAGVAAAFSGLFFVLAVLKHSHPPNEVCQMDYDGDLFI